MIVSFALAIAGVMAYEQFLERRLQYPEQVISDLGLPILGVVPNLKAVGANGRKGVSTERGARSAIEAFRALRTQLVQGARIEYPLVLTVTSPVPGDGKSLVSSNLSIAFAVEPGRTTVLIDGDMRRGSLHRLFGTDRAPGLADYLAGKVDASAIISQTDTEGLSVIPAGSYSEDAPELLDGHRLAELLTRLKQDFSVMIIDTPPLAAGIDAMLIGANADAVLAVLRTGRTDLELARTKLASYAQTLNVPIIGAVLNDVQEKRGPYRYYAYSYGYYSPNP